jgi:hypothetical protein
MTVAQMMDALAAQLQEELCGTANPPVIENLQVVARLNGNPTPPSIDIYPSTPFTEAIAYGRGSRQYWFTVRARITTVDQIAGQDLLLAMMDDGSAESVEEALRSVSGGTYAGAKLGNIEGPSEYGSFGDTGAPGDLLGCTWRVALIP